MSRKHVFPAVLIGAITLVLLMMQPGPVAQGQIDQPDVSVSNGRYQIATFSSGSTPGYYIIDTQTGALWHNFRDNEPSKVSGPLPSSD